MSTRYDGHMIQWKLGNCSTVGKYEDNKQYLHRCCLKPGEYTLTCTNMNNDHGWKKGYIEIQGHRYCDDFMGYKSMRRITILGINAQNL